MAEYTSHYLLNFLDQYGIQRTAKVSTDTYDKLMDSAKGRPTRNPMRSVRVEQGKKRPSSWMDDPKIQEAIKNLRETMDSMGGMTEETDRIFRDFDKKYGKTDPTGGQQPWSHAGTTGSRDYFTANDPPPRVKPEPFEYIYKDGFNPGNNRYANPRRPKASGPDIELQKLAGVEDISDDTLTKDERIKYLRRAKRKCHPDTGGSHEDWVNLEKLARRLSLKF